MEWTRAEAIAWAAGLFDGEGTTSASDRWDTPHVSVPQAGDSEPEVLRRLLEILHVGTISGPEMRLPHQPSWRFAVGGPTAVQVLELLWPSLGPVKRQQAELVLAAYRTHPTFSPRIARITGRPLRQTKRPSRRSAAND